MKKTLRHSLCSLSAIALLGFAATVANAWGAAGHRIVAIIAERNLNDSAKQHISEILGSNVSLASVANYADAVRNQRPETYNFHFVDIPLQANNYLPNRDCKNDPEKGDCIIAALDRFRDDLRSSSTSMAKKRFALKFIVHLIGDMHQPLHCAENNNDHGGGLVKVRWFGINSNLHKVWDTQIIEEAQLTDDEFADALDSELTQAQIDAMQNGTIIEWALQSHKLARQHSYKIPTSRELDQTYYDANSAVVDQQLLRGGLRLAHVLNTLWL